MTSPATTSTGPTTASEPASTVTFPPIDRAAPVQTARSLLAAFAVHVRRTPDAVAVVGGDRRLTYAELDHRAGVLAARLHDLGVGVETPVALIMARSVDLVIAELAVLKAGGVYVPLHPGQSVSRIRGILADTGATVLCTDPGADWLEVADLATVLAPATIGTGPGQATHSVAEVYPGQLAYIMFTSGSTGQPKGVAVTHDDVLGLASDPCFGVAQDAVLVNSSPAFDASTYEMWVPLLSGHTAVLNTSTSLDAPKLAALIAEHDLTAVFLTTALFNMITDEDPAVFAPLRQVWTGGDMISSPRAQRVVDACPDTIVVNSYGPTESTMFSHYHAVRAPHQVGRSMSIGRVMACMSCHVLDARLQPVAPGQIGELYLGGRGVARGYVRRPALTSERFVPDPFGPPGSRLYRTGDLGRPDELGRLEILGRSDKQVKIRGFRIELGEIESVVGEHPDVRAIVVLPHSDQHGEQRLVAYPVFTRPGVEIAELRSFAESRLADYMIPAFWIPVGELPVTSNGKVDRAALPAPDLDAVAGAGGAPRTDTERALAELFGELLGVSGIGVDDHFFALGGHSLLATRLAGRIRRSLGVEVALGDLFRNPTVRALAEHVADAIDARPSLDHADCAERVPLSPAQQRLWFLRQWEGPSGTYNIPVAIRLSGALDVVALRAALGDLADRHETLRTCYPATAGVPYQQILPVGSGRPGLSVIHCTEAELAGRLDECAARDIDISAELPLRAWLFDLGGNERVLLLVLHHIASDGWSMEPLGRDLRVAYRSRCAGAVPEWPELSVQYADYTLWQREMLGSADAPGSVLAGQLAFWQRTLDGAPDALDLPLDRPRPQVASTAGAIATGRLDAATHEALQRLAISTGCTMFMVLHTAFAALLTRIGAGTDLPIGTAVAGRTDEQLNDLIGFFVNTLVLRTDTTGDPTFHQLLHRVRNTDLDAYTNQDTPFDQLVETLNPERSTAHHPLFQVMLVLQNNVAAEFVLDGLRAQRCVIGHRPARFDLTMFCEESYRSDDSTPDGIGIELEYRTDLFDPETAALLARLFGQLLTAMVVDPNQRLGAVELASPAESTRILSEWNPQPVAVPEVPVHELVARQAGTRPDAVALRWDDRRLTYAELDTHANRIANELVARGVRRGGLVAVHLPRGPHLVTTLLGLLKTGAAYTLLDTEYPPARHAALIADARPQLVVSDSTAVLPQENAPELVLIDPTRSPDELFAGRSSCAPDVVVHHHDTACVIFTSGSTGKPKGVLTPHRALTATYVGPDYLPFGPDQVFLQTSPISWDAFALELFGALLHGATCVLPQHAKIDLHELSYTVTENKVTMLQLSAGLFNTIIDEQPNLFATLHTAITAGETASPAHVNKAHNLHPHLTIINGYGPVESLGFTTTHTQTTPGNGPIPIGTAITGKQLHILDTHLNPLPPTIPGDIYLAGSGLAHGYHNNPALTAQHFLPNPYGPPGTRIYRTGDSAQWHRRGTAFFRGRTDQQVKVRGFRVEPQEIESVITEHPHVTHTVVTANRTPSGTELAAYFTTGTPHHDLAGIQRHAAQRLPDYMMPAHWIALRTIPLTNNGKIDYRALPAPETTARTSDRHITVANPVEDILTSQFSAMLGTQIGPTGNFFHHGGHSLLATRLASRIRTTFDTDITVRDLFAHPTPRALATHITASTTTTRPQLTRCERPALVPLSPAQQRLWFLNRLDGTSSVYNVPLALRLTGELDAAALRAALADVALRHETLRTIYPEVDGTPVQVITVEPPRLDVVTVTADELAAVVEQACGHAFDLATEVPLRGWLFRTGPDESVLLLVLHHIAADGWSMAPLARDLGTAYRARCTGDAPAWSQAPVGYADYTLWQRELLGSADAPGSVLAGQLAFWRRTLDGAPDALDLPVDRQRPAMAGHDGDLLRFDLQRELHTGVLELAREHQVTVFMVLHAAFAALLTRIGAGTDLPIGTAVAGRTDEALDELVGFFVNTLVLRTDTTGDPTFRQLLHRVRNTDLDAYTNQDTPFDQLVEAVNPERSMAHHPLFQVMLVLQNNVAADFTLDGSRAEPYHLRRRPARFDLTMFCAEQYRPEDGDPAGIAVELEYRTDLFDRATAELLGRLFAQLLTAMVVDPNQRLGAVELASPAESTRILSEWNPQPVAVPEVPVHELVARQAEHTPDATAVAWHDGQLTYAELVGQAHRVAHELLARGVRRGDLVAVHLPRGPHLIGALLGVLTTGAAYTLLDTEYPAARHSALIADTTPRAVVTDTAAILAANSPAELVLVDSTHGTLFPDQPSTAPDVVVHHHDTACVIFTSGSTGKPKGVLTPHRALTATYVGPDYLPFGPEQVFLQTSPISWDAFALELFGALLHGATCVLPQHTKIDLHELSYTVTEHKVTMLQLSAGLFNTIIDEQPNLFATLHTAITAGETASPAHVNKAHNLHPHLTIINGYGPVESLGFTTTHTQTTPTPGPVPIGNAITGKQLHILDTHLNPLPPNIPGDIYLAGSGLAHGYHNNPALTAQHFLPNPYGAPGTRIYRTGDTGNWTANGTAHYRGRTDQQVKIRGFRVEPREIETVVARHGDVKHAVVTANRTPGGVQLTAYLTTTGDPHLLSVQQHAADHLPDYMVPAQWVVLDAIPLTPNGKVDHRALPLPERQTEPLPRATSDSPLEEILTTQFSSILNTPITPDDNFFHQGGHSLLATKLANRIRTALGSDITVRDLFAHPTPQALARHIAAATTRHARPPLRPATRVGDVPLSAAQQGLWFLREWDGTSSTYNVPLALRLTGELDVTALRAALADLIQRHEILRTIYPDSGGRPRQQVLDAAVPALIEVPCTGDELARRLDRAAAVDIDITTELPLRIWLFRVSATEHVLMLVLHHIAADGWSMAPLARDLGAAYAARIAGSAPEWAPLPVQYADYAFWQRESLGSPDDPNSLLATQLDHWRRTLAGAPGLLRLPVDRPRPPVSTTVGAIVHRVVDPRLHAALLAVAARTGSTLFMVLHTAVAALLTRIGAGTDVTIGTPVAGRTDEALHDLIGFFVNTLVLRTDTTGDPTFRELLHRIRDTDLDAYTNQDAPFDQLVETLNPERSTAHHPLFHVMLVLQNNSTAELDLAGLTTTEVPLTHRIAKFDLTFGVGERHSDGGLDLGLEYRTDLFDATTAESLLRGLEVLLTAIADDPEQRLGDVELMISAEHATAAVAQETATVPAGPSRHEDALRTLFAEVLDVAEIGPEDNFFARGGYSLLATRLVRQARAELGVELGVRALFQHPTPRALARHLTTAAPPPPAVATMPAQRRPVAIPLSPAQQRLWFQAQWDAAGAAYNIPIAIRLRGELDQSALVVALTDVVHRHESLRTIFPAVDGQPRQQVVDAASPVWTRVACTDDELADRLRTAAEHAFDLATDLPIQAWLFELGQTDAVLLLVVHHIAADGGSLRPLATDLATAYAARRHGRVPRFEPLPVQYADHTLRELARLGDAADPDSQLAEQLAFWRGTLHGVPDELVLPIDRPRPAVASQDGGHVDVTVDAATHGRLLDLCRDTGSTLFMVVQAAFAALLSRLGAGPDIPIGTATAGRDAPGIADAVGFFVNTIVLRADVSGRPSYHELLGRVQRNSLAAYGNADAPFERVVETINPPRSTGRHPLFQVMVVAQDGDGELLRLDGVHCAAQPIGQRIAEVDLFLGVREVRTGGVHCSLSYRTDLFDDATAAAIAERLGVLLVSVAKDPHRPVTEIDLLTTRDRQLLAAAGQGAQDAGADSPVHHEFERHARLAAGATALVTTEESVTAGELNTRANRLAHELIARRIGPGDRVALLMPRCAAAVMAMLAVHKAGAAFVQIDPGYPAARVAAIVAESRPSVTVTVASVAHSVACDLLVLDDPAVARRVATRPATDPADADRVRPLYPQDAAYVLYTSGSTGRPKGVIVEHRSLANLFRSHRATVCEPHLAGGSQPRARVATTASLSFDGSWIGLLWLITGHELHLLDDDLRREPASVAAYVRDHRVDFLDTSPTYAQELCAAGVLDAPAPRTLTLGGEAVPPGLWRRLREAPGVEAHNFYGPTECTVDSLQAPMAGSVEPNLGRPVRGTGVRVLDDNLQPVPPGVTGELYVTGHGLARGYLGQPAATAERFVPDPFGAPGERMYRSGDLARMRADGTLDFAGRADDQVKIRGFRIEPGEVEGVLSQHPSVAGAAVVVRDDHAGGPRLVAYAVLTAGAAADAAELRRFVAGHAPAHLVPAAVVLLDALPRTPNGKLDRAALPAPVDAGTDPGAGAPRTPLERLLCDVFAQTLGIERVPVDAGFFELGGHSLLASRLVGRISAALGTRVGVQDLFRAPTVAGLSALVKRDAAPAGSVVLLPLGGGGTGLPPLFCVHPVTGIAWCYSGLAALLGDDRPVYGLQSRVVDPARPPYRDLAEMVDEYVRHIRSVQPHGPYHLLGWSLGGNVAHAVAAALEAAGERVTMLALLDSYPPQQTSAPAPTPDEVIGYISREGMVAVGEDAELGGALARAAANNADIVDGAAPPDFTGNVLFFTATRDRDSDAPDASLWKHHVAGSIAEHDVDCAHLDMTRPEPLARIAAVITSALPEPS